MIHSKVKLRLWKIFRLGFHGISGLHLLITVLKKQLWNTEIRKKQKFTHTGGSKPNSRRRAEMMAETGRAQLYLDTHKKQDGTYVNEAAKEICEKIELVLSQSTVDESEVSPNDVVGEVLGKEHSGRVRCLGLGAVPSKVFKHARPRFGGMNASSSDASCLNHCQENYNKLLNAHNQSQENYKQMMNAFKAYMIMKEGTIPEQFAEFFASPPTTPRDAASGSLSPTAQEDHLMAIIQVKTIEVFYN